MAVGSQHIVKFHEDSVTGNPVFDSFERRAFTHDATFTTPTTTAFKENFTGTPNDAYIVKVSYPGGTEPAPASVTVDDLLADAVAAAALVYGAIGPSTV